MRRYLPFIAVFMAVLAAVHAFVYFVTVPENFVMAVLMTMAWLALPIGMLMRRGPLTLFAYFWLGFLFIAFSFALVEFALALVWDHGHAEWPWFAALLATAWSIFSALSPPRIINYDLPGPASMRGLTLVQISDVHIGMPFLDEKWLRRQVERINALNPDFVAVTGDLADGPFAETAPKLAPLADLVAKKFYVTGNHEFIRGGDWENRLRELGFRVLHNTHEIFKRNGGQFLVAGVPDRVILNLGERFESSPRKALATSEPVDYRILLAHEPKSVFHLEGAKCDLLLSGHVHGGQIFPFGVLVRLAQPLARGFKTINGTLVFAHMGTGYWGPPMRWLTRSEIVKFTWVDPSP